MGVGTLVKKSKEILDPRGEEKRGETSWTHTEEPAEDKKDCLAAIRNTLQLDYHTL